MQKQLFYDYVRKELADEIGLDARPNNFDITYHSCSAYVTTIKGASLIIVETTRAAGRREGRKEFYMGEVYTGDREIDIDLFRGVIRRKNRVNARDLERVVNASAAFLIGPDEEARRVA